VDDCRVLSGIIFVLKGGLRWRDAPPGYGPHKTLDNRFIRWSLAVLIQHRSGSVINEQFEALRSSLGSGPGAPIDNTLRITHELYQQLARLAASPAGAPLPVAGVTAGRTARLGSVFGPVRPGRCGTNARVRRSRRAAGPCAPRGAARVPKPRR
jgi:hypothetical protein